MLEIWPETVQSSNKFLAYFSAAQERKQQRRSEGTECRTILVVDDEETLANATVEILNIAGFCAFVAYDGQTALELAAKLHPDILLTDVVMPGMNGIELGVAIRKLLPETHILLISGQAGTIDLLEIARGEGNSFELIAKPIHPNGVSVFADSAGFVVFDPLARSDLAQDILLLPVKVRGNDLENRLADHLFCLVPEHAARRLVPTGDNSIQVLADDGVVGRLDNRGQPRSNLIPGGFQRMFALDAAVGGT